MQASKYRLITRLATIALFFVLTSCVQEYWPDLNTNNEQLLIVDGKISNFPGPYIVKLSSSSALNNLIENPVKMANVSIIDLEGNQENLTETSPGTYKTSPDGMRGIIGHSYQIKIDLNNGKHYESKFEELLPPVDVDSVYVEEKLQIGENVIESDKEGYQFYVNSKMASNAKTYFYWEIEETYEYHSDYKIIFLYDGRRYDPTEDNPFGLARTVNKDSLFYCWKTQMVPELFSYSTEYLSIPTISKLPLHFIPFTDERLRFKYGIQVKQYTISEDAYVFLDKLKQQNSNQDALFSTQPFQIRGNVVNLDDPSEPVLGYFMAASGVNSQRLLTKAPGRIRYDETKCYADTSMITIMYKIQFTPPANLPIFFTTVYFDVEAGIVPPDYTAYVRQDCLDCESKGGVVLKPEYWDW